MKILITEARDFSQTAIENLERAGCEVVARQYDYEELKNNIHDFEGIIVRLGIKVDKLLINSAPRLKFIATPTTGIDHIDLLAAKERRIKIISLQGESMFLKTITPTAELSISLMLNLMRHILPASQAVLAGKWERDRWIGRSMRGKTVGIIGMGRLGKMTAKLTKNFGCQIVYYDPYVKRTKYTKAETLAELAKTADIVSIHVPLNGETAGLIGAEYFRQAKMGQLMVNTSRGAVVREQDLIKALEAGRIGGAGLDVITDEMNGEISKCPIVKYANKHRNVIITPHIGGATGEGMRKGEEFIVEKIIRRQEEAPVVKIK